MKLSTSLSLLSITISLCSISFSAGLSSAQPPPPQWGIPPHERVQAFHALPAAGEVSPWGITRLAAATAWAKGVDGTGVTVAVLDTGIDKNHPDLKDRLKAAADFTGSRSGTNDVQGHGTHCAGSILASRNNDGVVGMAPGATLIVGKVLGDSGSGSVTGIANGIKWATAQGADVISMSLGGPSPDSWTQAAVREAEAAGVIICAAAGNEGPGRGTVGWPGGYPQCVCVAATDERDATANFSSRGPQVYIAGPGVQILSTYPGGRYSTMSGTSMATPHVAGLAALWCQANPAVAKKERPAAFKTFLRDNAKDMLPAGRDEATGYGVTTAATLAGGSVPPPPPPPGPVKIDLGPTDFSPTGIEKLRLLNPRLTGISFTLAPGGVAIVPTPMPSPAPVVVPVAETHHEWFDVPGVGRRLITVNGPGPALPALSPVLSPSPYRRFVNPDCPECRR